MRGKAQKTAKNKYKQSFFPIFEKKHFFMRISKIHLQNFKRFTDLSIEQIPDSSKLVLLIGANGSGKSSVFDAFELIHQKDNLASYPYHKSNYYFKNQVEDSFSILLEGNKGKWQTNSPKVDNDNSDITIKLDDKNPYNFYGRTSFRNLQNLSTNFNANDYGEQDVQEVVRKNMDSTHFFTEIDKRWEGDILFAMAEAINSRQTVNTLQILKDNLNEYLAKIFVKHQNSLFQIESIEAITGTTQRLVLQVKIQKGASIFPYEYLSAGEKQVFAVLFNLFLRIKYHEEAIYYLDELDLHLNTHLQQNFLRVIVEDIIPPNSQLWTASHSLGFIEYAKQSAQASIIDFDNYDFDQPKVLTPEPKDNPAIYEIAVGKEYLKSLFRDKKICFVENQDKKLYSLLGFEDIIFVPEINRNAVYHKVRTSEFYGLVDRDFLNDEDIKLIQKHYPKLSILTYYAIENYLYHPDNLEEYYQQQGQKFDKDAYKNAITEVKNQMKDKILIKIASDRESYGYFKEKDIDSKRKDLTKRFEKGKENFEQTESIATYLNSQDFETFYKVLSMKDYATNLSQRQNIAKSHLARTHWFKTKFKEILKTK